MPRLRARGAFFFAEKLRSERQPLFPGNVETSFGCDFKDRERNVREAGVFQVLKSKGVSCERERYSEVV